MSTRFFLATLAALALFVLIIRLRHSPNLENPRPLDDSVSFLKETRNPPRESDREFEEDARYPLERDRWFYAQRVLEDGTIPREALLTAGRHKAKMLPRQGATADAGITSMSWEWLGPGNIGGRTRAIVIHPVRTNEMLLAGVTGGIWKSLDGGSSWAPVNDFLANLNVSCMALDPTSPEIVYAGTGEWVSAFFPVFGAGVFKSVDFGASWTQLPNTASWQYVNKLAVSPENGQVVLAATAPTGIFRSTDGGNLWNPELPGIWVSDVEFDPSDEDQIVAADAATPQAWYWDSTASTWQLATFPQTVMSTTLTSVGNCPGSMAVNDLLVVASTTGFDGGDTVNVGMAFTAGVTQVVNGTQMCISAGVPAPVPPVGTTVTVPIAGNVELAVARSNPNIVYALMNVTDGALLRSNDGGRNYTLVTADLDFMWGQGSYNNAVWVDPVNPARIILGGGEIIASIDGGTTFRPIGTGGHADRHIIVEHPAYDGGSDRRVYQGSDGGIHVTSNPYASFGTLCREHSECSIFFPLCVGGVCAGTSGTTSSRELNNNLGITQFVHVAVYSDPDPTKYVILGGTQDNGTLRRDQSTGTERWTAAAGGDGGWSAIDPTDPNFIYTEYINARITRGTNGRTAGQYIHAGNADRNGNCCTAAGVGSGGNCRAVANPPPAGSLVDACTGAANFYSPFVLDPNNVNRLLVGAARLWRSNNAKAATPTWTAVTNFVANVPANPMAGSANISAVDVAVGNSNLIWIGYTNGDVYMTTTGTAALPAWIQVDTNAPAMPSALTGPLPNRTVTSIHIDRNDSNRVYVTFGGYAADTVFKTLNGGTDWQMISGGTVCDATRPSTALPCVQINAMIAHPNQPGWLYVATDLGVFASENDGLRWSGANDGPANVVVFALTWKHGNQLVAATHGRGVYKTAAIIPDCNGNGTQDSLELAGHDCNRNFRLDECDLLDTSLDCNGNALPDECEIHEDSTAPGGPYFCVLDCDSDCNDTGTPDACEEDCNGNFRPDDCDLASSISLTRGLTLTAGLRPSSIATADFNGDGFPDFAVANWNSTDISVLLNRGNDPTGNWLGFRSAVDYPVPPCAGCPPLAEPGIPWALTVADFDRDGAVDVAYVFESGDIRRLMSDLDVLLNRGDGTFARAAFGPILTNVASFRAEAIAAGDFNDDSFPDLVITNTRSGAGVGRRDVTLIRNDGANPDGTWRRFVPPVGAQFYPDVGVAPVAIALGRFNLDGYLDIATANEDSSDLSVLINDGAGHFNEEAFYPLVGTPSDLAAGRINADLVDDLAVVFRDRGFVHTFRSRGDSTFTGPLPVAAGLPGLDGVLLADVDQEGSQDLVVGAQVLLNRGDGVFGLPFPCAVDSAVSLVRADVDRDGDTDLAGVAGTDFSRVHVALNDSDVDCNQNGVPDGCEIDGGSLDADHDGLLDECEIGACDQDGDHDCDLADYRRLNDCWRGPGVPCGLRGEPFVPKGGDLDGDYDGDLRDFAILQNQFTGPRECCVAHGGAGCNDFRVQRCVCDALAPCCLDAWTEACVAILSVYRCGDCALQAGCGDGTCGEGETCVTCPRDCGACSGPCCSAHDSVGCEIASTVSCVCDVLPDCCEGIWTDECARVASDPCSACCGDGVCGPGENCRKCRRDCTNCLPACGDKFCTVGESCRECPEDCGPCDDSCCLAHDSPGCEDPSVQACVCSFLPECCQTGWSALCAVSSQQCGTCRGDCCAAHDESGCSNYDLMSCVCAIEPNCCFDEWKPECAETAAVRCGGCCGNARCDPFESCSTCPQDCGTCPPVCGDFQCNGNETCQSCPSDCIFRCHDCCTAGGPGCTDFNVQTCVCTGHFFCCSTGWDQECVGYAVDCGANCTGGHDCCTPGGPGCNDMNVAKCVCAQEFSCCKEAWTSACVNLVESLQCGSCP